MSASTKKKLRKEENAAQLTEKQLNEQKEAKKLKTYTTVFAVIISLVLLIGIGSLVYTAYNTSGISERATKAATIGEHELNSVMLNYFFMDTVNENYQNWYNSFGEYTTSYVSMLYGLDLTKPLNTQTYDAETGKSYADYFAEMAVEKATAAYAVYDEAMANGHELTEEEKTGLESSIQNLDTNAMLYGYSSAKDFLRAYYGNGASVKSFTEYMEILTVVSSYEEHIYHSLTYTDSDLAAHNEEHYDEFSSFSYLTFSMTDDDFLMCNAAETDPEHKHTDEELSKAATDLTAGANTLVDAKPTDAESFNAAIQNLFPYAKDETAVCEEVEDLLYSSITNEDLAAWLTEEGRTAGDIVLLPNESETTDADGNKTTTLNGYTVALYLSRNDNEMNLLNVRHILKSFEGGTTDDSGNTVYSEEEKNAAKDAITELMNKWVDEGATEESFIELAKEKSTDTGSAANGGLYENVYPGQMTENFNNWCFDETRVAGDYEIVETEYGYHLIYFVGKTETTFRNYMIENTLREEDYNGWYDEIMDAMKVTVHNTSKLSLGATLAS